MPGCGLHPWPHQAVSRTVRLEPATHQSVLNIVLTLSFSGSSFVFSASLWEVQFPSRYMLRIMSSSSKTSFVLFLFIFRASCFHFIDVIKFPLPMFMNFFSTVPQIISFLQGCFLVYLFISLCIYFSGFSFALDGSCFVFILTTDEYCLLVACCNKLLTTNFVAYNNRHVLSYRHVLSHSG